MKKQTFFTEMILSILILLLFPSMVFPCIPIPTGGGGPRSNGARLSMYGFPMPFADPKATDLYMRDIVEDLRTENRNGYDITFNPASKSATILINIIPKLNYLGGSEIGLGISLTYNSAGIGDLGWFYDFNSRAVITDWGVRVVDTRGNTLHFEKVVDEYGNITYENKLRKSNVYYTYCLLEPSEDPGHPYIVWRQTNGVKYYYDYVEEDKDVYLGNGYRLLKVVDRNGNGIHYQYNHTGEGLVKPNRRYYIATKIREDTGKEIQIFYDKYAMVSRLIDPAGRNYEIKAKSNRSVEKIVYPDGSELNMETGNLEGYLYRMTTPNGHDFIFEYSNNAVSTFSAPDGVLRFIGAPNSFTKYLEDKKGHLWTYRLNADEGLKKLITEVNGEEKISLFTRIPFEDLVSEYTDFNGNTMRYEYDMDNGQVIKRTDANGLESHFEYDPEYNKVIKYTDPMGRVSTRILDDKGNNMSVTDPLGHTTSYAYDAFGNLKTKTDPNGHTMTFEYNVYGNVTKVIDPLGHEMFFTYDIMNNRLSQTDANGNTTQYQYNNMDRLVKIIHPDGTFKTMTYDANGNKISEINERGHTALFTYDFNNNLIKTEDALGQTTETTYSVMGTKIMEKDKKGNITKWKYDEFARVIEEEDALGNKTQLTYNDNCGDPFIEGGKPLATKVINKRGYVTESTYDAGYRLMQSIDAKGGTVKNQYDNGGNLRFVTDQNELTTEKIYDAASRVVKVIDPLGHTAESVYDANGNVIKSIDANGNEAQYVFDKRNKLDNVTDVLGHNTRYVYDPVGSRKQVTDARGKITSYSYDNRNRLKQAVNPLGDLSSYSYDGMGNRISSIDENGNETKYNYDELNRITKVIFPDASERLYAYNANSSLLKLEDISGAIEYAYDKLNRVTTVKNPYGHDISYAYNKNSLRISMNVDGVGTVSYAYDELDRLVSQNDFDGKTNSFAYDPAGRRISMKQGNGITTSYNYDNASRLLSKKSSAVNLSYNYDNVGNILTMNDDAGKTTYAYDGLYRLTGVSYPDAVQETFLYDEVGNRQKNTVSGVETDYVYNDFNQLIIKTVGNETTGYKYDKHGNLKQKNVETTIIEEIGQDGETKVKTIANKTNYVYNFEYDLIHISKQGAENCSFSYDAQGRRIKRAIAGGDTQLYLYDGLNIVADLNTNTSIKNIYNTELQLDQMLSAKLDGEKRYYHTDHLGSISKITNKNRNIVASYIYEAFGKKRSESGEDKDKNRYSFTGREDEDEFGLMYYRARYYDPDTGRFISPDPFTRGPDDPRVSYLNNWYAAIHGEATLYAAWLNPHSFNRYLYCNNNPVGFVDPLGLDGFWSMWLNSLNNTCDAIGMSYGALAYDASHGTNSSGIYNKAGSKLWSTSTPDAPDATPYVAASLGVSATAIAIAAGAGISELLTASNEVTDAAKDSTTSPFKGKSANEVDKMFKDKGFEPKGPDPKGGKGGYVNQNSGRSYHIDENNSYGEKPHVDINRPKSYKGNLPKKKYDM